MIRNPFSKESQAYCTLQDFIQAAYEAEDLASAVEESGSEAADIIDGMEHEITELKEDLADASKRIDELLTQREALSFGKKQIELELFYKMKAWVVNRIDILEEELGVKNKDSDSGTGTGSDAGAETDGAAGEQEDPPSWCTRPQIP